VRRCCFWLGVGADEHGLKWLWVDNLCLWIGFLGLWNRFLGLWSDNLGLWMVFLLGNRQVAEGVLLE